MVVTPPDFSPKDTDMDFLLQGMNGRHPALCSLDSPHHSCQNVEDTLSPQRNMGRGIPAAIVTTPPPPDDPFDNETITRNTSVNVQMVSRTHVYPSSVGPLSNHEVSTSSQAQSSTMSCLLPDVNSVSFSHKYCQLPEVGHVQGHTFEINKISNVAGAVINSTPLLHCCGGFPVLHADCTDALGLGAISKVSQMPTPPLTLPRSFSSTTSTSNYNDECYPSGSLVENPWRTKPKNWTTAEDQVFIELIQKHGDKNWKQISRLHMNGMERTPVQCLHRWKKVLKPGIVKGPWTADEDQIIINLWNQGTRKWSEIASYVTGRLGKQCRERWINHLDPTVCKNPWAEHEMRTLLIAHGVLGNKWRDIAAKLPGRSENNIKNKFHSLVRKLNSRKRCYSEFKDFSHFLQNAQMMENVNGNDVDCDNITMHKRRFKIERTSGVDEKCSRAEI